MVTRDDETSSGAGTVECYGVTDVGRQRRSNEDQFLIAELNKSMLTKQSSLSIEDDTRHLGGPQGQLLLVADGMGGQAAGDRASTIAVDTVMTHVLNMMPWFFRLDTTHSGDLRNELRSLFEECQTKIENAAARNSDRKGMGTTLTMAYVLWPNAYIVHVGDSRCYLLRDRRLEQVTRDHTLAQRLVENGALEESEAAETRLSHMLWNALGGNDDALHPEVYTARLDLGDTLLLATDGLTKHVADEEILRFLEADETVETTANRMVEAANDAGGSDNVTVVIARFRKIDQFAGVDSAGCPAGAASKPQPSDARQEVPEPPQQAYLKNLDAQIAAWRTGVEELKSAARRRGPGAAAEPLEALAELEEPLRAAQVIREEVLSNSEPGTWDSLKERAGQTWDGLRAGFSRLLSR